MKAETYHKIWLHCSGDALDRHQCFYKVFKELGWMAFGVAGLANAAGWFKRETENLILHGSTLTLYSYSDIDPINKRDDAGNNVLGPISTPNGMDPFSV